MFRNMSRGHRRLKINNFFISQPIFKCTCNTLNASVLSHLSNSIYFNMHFEVTSECFPFLQNYTFLVIYMALTRSPQIGQLTSANYCSNHVTQLDTTIKYIIASLGQHLSILIMWLIIVLIFMIFPSMLLIYADQQTVVYSD